MNFTFTDEQQMLLETTRRFAAKDYDFAHRQQINQSTNGFSQSVWQGFADLGLLALTVPEADGGLGGDAIDTMLVMSAMGEALVLEPYLASAALASQLIVGAASEAQRQLLLPQMVGGELVVVPAHEEASSRFDWTAIETTATATADGFKLNGKKVLVAHAANAHFILVTARMANQTLAIFAVPRDAAGLQVVSYRTVDGVCASDVTLNNVMLDTDAQLTAVDDATKLLGAFRSTGIAALCAEATGVLDKLLAATVTFVRERQQFGTPIGKFQALQHRLADMVLHIEQARSMAYLAAVRCTDTDEALRDTALSAAKVVIGQACRFVGQQAVQLHGGMGVTDELIVSHYFKRLMAIELQFGSTDDHLEQYAAQLQAA